MADRFDNFLSDFGGESDKQPSKVQFADFGVQKRFDKLRPETQLLTQELPKVLGGKAVITSTYRDPTRNEMVGGVPGSEHTKRNAFDVRTRNLSKSAIDELVNHYNSIPGVRAIFEPKKSHVHIERHGGSSEASPQDDSGDSIDSIISEVTAPTPKQFKQPVTSKQDSADDSIDSIISEVASTPKPKSNKATSQVTDGEDYGAIKSFLKSNYDTVNEPSIVSSKKPLLNAQSTLGDSQGGSPLKEIVESHPQVKTALEDWLGTPNDGTTAFDRPVVPPFISKPAVAAAYNINPLGGFLESLRPYSKTVGDVSQGAKEFAQDTVSGSTTPKSLAAIGSLFTPAAPATIIGSTPFMAEGAYESGKEALGNIERGETTDATKNVLNSALNALMTLGGAKYGLGKLKGGAPVEAPIKTPEVESAVEAPQKIIKATPEDQFSVAMREKLAPESLTKEPQKIIKGKPSEATEGNYDRLNEILRRYGEENAQPPEVASKGSVASVDKTVQDLLKSIDRNPEVQDSVISNSTREISKSPKIEDVANFETKLPEVQEPISKQSKGVYLGSGFGGIQEAIDQGVMPKSRMAEMYNEKPVKLIQETGETKTNPSGIERAKYEMTPEGQKLLGDYKDIGGLSASNLSFKDAARVAEQLDKKFSGPVKRQLVDTANRLEARTLFQTKALLDKVQSELKGVDFKLLQKYGEDATANEGTPSKLSNRERAKIENNPELKAKLDRGVSIFRNIYDSLYNRLRDAGVDVPYRKDYFPHIREHGLLSTILSGNSMEGAGNPFIQSMESSFPYRFRRMLEKGYQVDALSGLKAYAKNAYQLIHSAPEVPKMRAIVNALPPNAQIYFNRFIDQNVLGKMNEWDRKFQQAAPRTKAITDIARNSVMRNVVRFNASIATQQPSSIVNTFSGAGRYALSGAVESLSPKVKEFWKKNSPEYFARTADLEYKPGMMGSVEKFANFAMEQLDRHMVATALQAFYKKGLSQGMTEPAAIRYANDWAMKTQASVLKSMKTPFQQNPVGKNLGLLQNFTINLYNYFTKDLPNMARFEAAGQEGAVRKFLASQRAVGAAVKFAAGAYAVNAMYKAAGLKEPIDATSAMPLIGSMKYGIPNPVLNGVFSMAKMAAYKDDPQQFKKAANDFSNSMTALVGPLQIKKTAQAAYVLNKEEGKVKDKKGRTKYTIETPQDKVRAYVYGINQTDAARGYKGRMDARRQLKAEQAPSLADQLEQAMEESVGKTINPNYQSDKLKKRKVDQETRSGLVKLMRGQE